jgi:hypothetical protein
VVEELVPNPNEVHLSAGAVSIKVTLDVALSKEKFAVISALKDIMSVDFDCENEAIEINTKNKSEIFLI